MRRPMKNVMRKMMMLAGFAVMAAPGVFAQDRWDLRRDYRREVSLQNEIARDRARLQEDLRCGRREAAFRDRAELVRDERLLQALRRDVRYDRRDYRDNRRDWR